MTIAQDDIGAVNAIRALLQEAENAFDAGRAAAVLSDDAVLMVPDFPVQEGRTACVDFLHDIMGWLSTHYERRIIYTSAEVVVTGDLAFDRGTFSFSVSPRTGGDVRQVTGKYLWLLRRSDRDAWTVTRLIVSRDDESPGGDEVSSETPPA